MDAKHSLLSQTDSDEEVLHEVTTSDGLKFQDVPMTGAQIKTPEKSGSFTSFPTPGDDDGDDKTELLSEGERKQPPIWTFEYYQTWFDVDTHQVSRRILGSMTPRPGRNYLRMDIRPNPDLYGPFWICTTLVFTTAICGNLANYISCGRYDYQWTYDFHKVTLAATAIFFYWWFIPTGVYGLMVWRFSQSSYSYMEIICVYGYSLAIYIPISILWVIPFAWLQWTLVLIGSLLSGSVLLFTFWPVFREDVNRKISAGVMAAMLLFHGTLAVGFVLYFFHVPESSCPHEIQPVLTTPVAPPHVSTPAPVLATGGPAKAGQASGLVGQASGLVGQQSAIQGDAGKPVAVNEQTVIHGPARQTNDPWYPLQQQGAAGG